MSKKTYCFFRFPLMEAFFKKGYWIIGVMMLGSCAPVCSSPKPLQDKAGWCYACDNPYAFETTEQSCRQCPNRIMNAAGRCALKECPSDQPMQDGGGWCYDCAREFPIDTTPALCDQCPNRQMMGRGCALKKCPVPHPVQDKDGFCYPCDQDFSTQDISSEQCAQCPNLVFEKGRCVLKDENK